MDVSSGAAVAVLDIQTGHHVLDLCCAPGRFSFFIFSVSFASNCSTPCRLEAVPYVGAGGVAGKCDRGGRRGGQAERRSHRCTEILLTERGTSYSLLFVCELVAAVLTQSGN